MNELQKAAETTKRIVAYTEAVEDTKRAYGAAASAAETALKSIEDAMRYIESARQALKLAKGLEQRVEDLSDKNLNA